VFPPGKVGATIISLLVVPSLATDLACVESMDPLSKRYAEEFVGVIGAGSSPSFHALDNSNVPEAGQSGALFILLPNAMRVRLCSRANGVNSLVRWALSSPTELR
jgi:hypothetical protein